MYCWLLRIGGPHPISEAALGERLASRTSIGTGDSNDSFIKYSKPPLSGYEFLGTDRDPL